MSEKINDGGPAFPSDMMLTKGVVSAKPYGGMSLRDWFAGQALAAMITKAPFFDREGEFGNPVDMMQFKADMAESAYCYADAMIAARGAGE